MNKRSRSQRISREWAIVFNTEDDGDLDDGSYMEKAHFRIYGLSFHNSLGDLCAHEMRGLVNGEFLHILLRALHGLPVHLSMDIACSTHQDESTIIDQT